MVDDVFHRLGGHAAAGEALGSALRASARTNAWGCDLRGRGPSTHDVRPAFRKEEKTTFECQAS
jgi:hypothetical protein